MSTADQPLMPSTAVGWCDRPNSGVSVALKWDSIGLSGPVVALLAVRLYGAGTCAPHGTHCRALTRTLTFACDAQAPLCMHVRTALGEWTTAVCDSHAATFRAAPGANQIERLHSV